MLLFWFTCDTESDFSFDKGYHLIMADYVIYFLLTFCNMLPGVKTRPS